VFVQTNPFEAGRAFYANAVTLGFPVPTQDSTALVRAATRGVDQLFRAGDAYRKAGVLLPDVVPVEEAPADLFAEVGEGDRTRRRMAVLDAVNRKYGRETLRFAGQLSGSGWRRRS
jgi:DNA polymerase V